MRLLAAPRRRRLASALAVGAVLIGGSVAATGPAPASAAPHPVRAHLRHVGLNPLGDAAQSSVVDTGGRLHIVGVTWPMHAVSTRDRVQYRVKEHGGWSGWSAMAADEDHAPDPGTAEAAHARGGTDPYVVSADAVQVRVLPGTRRVPTGLSLEVVDPSVSPADVPAGPGRGAAGAAGSRPYIYTRAQWGADESLRTGTPEYGTIKAGFVHHTVNANSYTSAQVPAIIRGIYAFHTESRGWSDIGYNFLIDRFGRTWEGRAGGVDRPVIGAHTGGYNSQLFGAAGIGTFATTAPSSSMLAAFNRLFAWKLSLAHVDPAAKVTLTGMSTSVSTVGGHRDADGAPNNTECPGDAMYAKLGSIRAAARSLMGAAFFEPRADKSSWAYGQAGATITARPNRTLSWTLQVRSACRPDLLLATVKGSATTSGLVARWSGRLASGAWAPPGGYLMSLSASAGTGTINTVPPYTVRVEVAGAPGAPQGYCPVRLAGADRYATAVSVAKIANPTATTVVLASGVDTGMPDALAAGPLARATNAALLLTGPATLPSSVSATVAAQHMTTAYLVGGTGVISTAIESQLRSLGVTTVVRYAGSNRFATAAAVAEAMAPTAPDVLVANGSDGAMVDGLALSGVGAGLGRPVLFVTASGVPAATAGALRRLGTQRTVVAGSTGVVPDAVLRALPSPTRVAGSDRYGTAAALASWAASFMPTADVVLTSGDQAYLADTLAGAQLGRVTLYGRPAVLPSATASWLDNAPQLRSVLVLGGTAGLADLVAGRAQRAVLG